MVGLAAAPLLPHSWTWLWIAENLVIVGYFVAVVAFTKPTGSELGAAVAGIAPLVTYQLIFDPVVARHDLFRFEAAASRPALTTYPQTLVAFTMMALLAWYLWGRFGGQAVVGLALIGAFVVPLRDLAFAHTTHWIEFGPGLWPWVIDSLGNAAAMAMPVLVMRALLRRLPSSAASGR